MRNIVIVTLLGAALFMGVVWQLDLLSNIGGNTDVTPIQQERVVTPEDQLGDFLYKPAAFVTIPPAALTGSDIILHGVMQAIEQEEVPSQVPGRVWFIGEEVDDAVVLASGSAAFLTEPYYEAKTKTGPQWVTKYYRRLYEGQQIKEGQMVSMIEPAKAIGQVLGKIAKVGEAQASVDAAKAAEKEGYNRWLRALDLRNRKAISEEDYGAALLTKIKLQSERISAQEKVKMAEQEKYEADIELSQHELRPLMPYKHSSIKSIVRQRGYAVKPGDPVIVIQNLDRLQAEALIEQQYFAHLKEIERQKKAQNQKVTATIEPSILEKPLIELPGHDREVTSVAVSRDKRIVSGSEDRSVCVWTRDGMQQRKFDTDEAVRVVACAPADAGKNVCVAGCANGDINIWDLDGADDAPITILKQAHGDNTAITALAFSADGKYFATGASDGSIRLWNADGTELYPFDPEHGVKHAHEDAVTAVHFTPQCRLVSAGRDKTLRVWKLREKGAVADGKAIANREGSVGQLGVSHDGKWMLFDQLHGRMLKLLSLDKRKLEQTLDVPVNGTPFDTLAIFSPDGSLILTAGAPDGHLQLWRTPGAESRTFEVRQFAPKESLPVTCAAFASDSSFAVSASGQKIYLWSIPTKVQVQDHRIKNVPITLQTRSLDPSTRQARVGFEIANPDGRFEAGRPARIVIE